jgi:hypothetical protein
VFETKLPENKEQSCLLEPGDPASIWVEDGHQRGYGRVKGKM